jgi:hypothetical protein
MLVHIRGPEKGTSKPVDAVADLPDAGAAVAQDRAGAGDLAEMAGIHQLRQPPGPAIVSLFQQQVMPTLRANHVQVEGFS